MIAEVDVLLGGRAAEEVFFNEISTGASNDLERATDILKGMIQHYGMSDVTGLMVLEKKQNSFLGGSLSSSREFSEETAQKVDNFIKTQLDERYKIVKNNIEKYRDAIENMVSALYKTETLTGAEVRRIIGDFENEQGYETMLQSNKSEETKKDLNLEKTSSEKTDLNE